MKFLAKHISLTSLDDPDFTTMVVFNEFFNAEIFEVYVDTLFQNSLMVDEKIPLINNLFAELNLKGKVSQSEKEADEVKKAALSLRCKMYDQFLRVYYTMAFSLNGKINFERYHMDIMNLLDNRPVIDRFFQIKDGSIFAYAGPLVLPKEEEEELDEEEKKKEGPKFSNKPQIAHINIPKDEKIMFLAEIVDRLFTKDKKKGYNMEKLLDSIEKIQVEQEEKQKNAKNIPVLQILKDNSYPIIFGTDKFEGLRFFLTKYNDYKCPTTEIGKFRGRINDQAKFVEQSQKEKLILVLDEYLQPKMKDNDN